MRIAVHTIIAIAFATCLFGQTSQISGVVADSSEAAVPGAIITVIAADTGLRRTAVSNVHGIYTVPLLPPGKYVIEVTGSVAWTVH